MFSPRTKVLVVDDFSSVREMTVRALKELGFIHFIEAADGKIAWRALLSSIPPVGLIICDWNMPNSTGIDFLKKVRASERFKDLPFIISTTNNEKDQVLEAINLGVSNFIVKPCTVETLRQKLETIANKKAQTKN